MLRPKQIQEFTDANLPSFLRRQGITVAVVLPAVSRPELVLWWNHSRPQAIAKAHARYDTPCVWKFMVMDTLPQRNLESSNCIFENCIWFLKPKKEGEGLEALHGTEIPAMLFHWSSACGLSSKSKPPDDLRWKNPNGAAQWALANSRTNS